MLNQQGSTTLLHCFFALILSLLLLIFFHVSTQNYQNMKVRARTYLCFKYQVTQLDKYVRKMGSFNRELAALYPMQFIPEVGAGFKALHKSIVAIQDLYHLNYLKKVAKNPYCKPEQGLGFIHHLSYQTEAKIKLKRHFNGVVAVVKRDKVTIMVPSQLKPAKNAFILKATIEIKDSFSTTLKFNSEELDWNLNLKFKTSQEKPKRQDKQVLQSSKPLSGSRSISFCWFQDIKSIDTWPMPESSS